LRHYAENVPPPVEWSDWYFNLIDIDLDGVPELIISWKSTGILGEAIYTFSDGIQPIEGAHFFTQDGLFSPHDGRAGVVIPHFTRFTLYTLNDYKLTAEIQLNSPDLLGALYRYLDGVYEPWFIIYDVPWFINNEEVSKDEFFEMFFQIMPSADELWYFNNRPVPINEETINELVFGW